MTTETETAEQAKATSKSGSTLASVLVDLGITAAGSWLTGIALHVGFGVSAPFVAAWLLALVGLWGGTFVLGQLAKVWHHERVKADIDLLAASMAAQDMLHAQPDGLADFLAKLEHPADKDSGAYL